MVSSRTEADLPSSLLPYSRLDVLVLLLAARIVRNVSRLELLALVRIIDEGGRQEAGSLDPLSFPWPLRRVELISVSFFLFSFRLADPARALSRMKESFDTIMKQKELLSASGSSSQPTIPPFPPSSSSSSRRNQPPPQPSSSTAANSFYDSIASLSSSSRFNNQPPPPHRPSFDDFGPSSQSSSSLAQLFAVKTADEDRKSRRAERPIYRQDPIDLGYLTEEDSRILFAL